MSGDPLRGPASLQALSPEFVIDYLKNTFPPVRWTLLAAAWTSLAFGAVSLPAFEELESQLPETLMPPLGQLLSVALEASNEMVAREFVEAEALGRKTAYRSALLPGFSGAFIYRHEEDQNRLGARFEERLIYQLTLTQPLYHWGARKAENEMGKLQYQAELLNSQTVAERVVGALRTLYMNLLLDRQELVATEIALDLKRRELETQRVRMEEGVASITDVFNAELEIERLELSQAREEARWSARLDELAELLKIERAALDERLAGEIPAVQRMEPDQIQALTQYFEEGLARSEALQRKELEIESDRQRLLIEKTALRPKLDFQAGVSQNAIDADGVRREQEFIYGGIRVNWAIFDGFRAKGRTQEARVRLQRNEHSKLALRESLLREFRRALANLEFASRGLSIEEKLLSNRSGGLEKGEEDFADGRISELQFKEMQQGHQRQYIKTQQARAAYLNAISELSLLLGIDSAAMDGRTR